MSDPNSLLEHLSIALPIQRYGLAVDSQNFALFDDVFSAEAVLDYESAGGRYHDELIKKNDRWWICQRRFEATWSDGVNGATGPPDITQSL